jgi:hypothetical protein
VGIEDSGIPLGVQALPPGLRRLSRSMSLNRQEARWYLIAQRNTTMSQAIVAAETTGSIVGRVRIAWVYEYGVQSDMCNETEGPLLSTDRNWLFVINSAGILIVADNGKSASAEYLVSLPGLCTSNMAFSEADSILLVVDRHTYNIIALNVSTRTVSYISLTDICQENITGQLSRMTVVQNHRLILVIITAARKALLLLIDYDRHTLLASLDLGYVSEIAIHEPLTQLAYTETDEQQFFVTIAHKAVGLIAVQLCMFNKKSIFILYFILLFVVTSN